MVHKLDSQFRPHQPATSFQVRSTATTAATAPINGAATIAGGTAQPKTPPMNAAAIPTATPFPNPPPRRPDSHEAARADKIAGPNQIDSNSRVEPGVGLPGHEDKTVADVGMFSPLEMQCEILSHRATSDRERNACSSAKPGRSAFIHAGLCFGLSCRTDLFSPSHSEIRHDSVVVVISACLQSGRRFYRICAASGDPPRPGPAARSPAVPCRGRRKDGRPRGIFRGGRRGRTADCQPRRDVH